MLRSGGFAIRSMEDRDLDVVESIERASSLIPWSKAMFISEMAHPYASCFVITSEENSDRVVGFICFRIIGQESELLNICIDPGHRHRGLGGELMRFYTSFSIQRGTQTFHLEVRPENRFALRLYSLFSYRPVGVRPKFYRGEFDALRMMRRV